MTSEMSLTALRVQLQCTVSSGSYSVATCELLWPQTPEQSDWNASCKRQSYMKAIGVSN